MIKLTSTLKIGGVVLLIILVCAVLLFILGQLRQTVVPVDYSSDTRCQRQDAKYLNATLPISVRVDDLMERMNDAEKIGQMVIVEKDSIYDINDISRYNLGALLSGGGAGPTDNTPIAWLQMIQNFQSAAHNTCLGIPLLYGIDAIHGHANVLGATIFPHSIGLGATHDKDLVKHIAQATADEMAATGIYWSYSPNLDVPQDLRWGKTYETFGSDTATVTQLGSAYLKGLQDSSHPYLNVLGTAKHYLGGGAMEYGTSRNTNFKIEEGNISLSEAVFRKEHLVPFQQAIANGLKTVMVGTASWNGIINPANHYLLTDVLKNELGFSGFVVSDWYAVYEISPDKYKALVTGINAGVDMVMTPFEYKNFTSDMQKALAQGDISHDRLNDAVRRILTVKFQTGLFDRPAPTTEGLSVVGSKEHRDLARQAVRESQVLLKNTHNSLPLSPSIHHVIVAGSGADNLGRQSGGWTIEWQGIDGNWIPGTTILNGIKNTVSPQTNVEYSLTGDFVSSKNLADVGIVVISEKPYAEGIGDNAHPEVSVQDLATIKKVKAQSKKLIVIIIAGRPLDIKPYIHDWDGVIASWLPGSEGQGVADVLFGQYPFTGTLPVTWEY